MLIKNKKDRVSKNLISGMEKYLEGYIGLKLREK